MGTTYPTNKPLNDIIAVAYAPWLPPPLLINAAALKNDSITQLRRHTAVSLQWRLMLWPRSDLVPNRSIDVSASCLWLLSEILTPGDKFPPRTRSVYKVHEMIGLPCQCLCISDCTSLHWYVRNWQLPPYFYCHQKPTSKFMGNLKQCGQSLCLLLLM